jgi:hypothetical protein
VRGLRESLRNPFILILLVAGAALVVIGVGMYLHAYVGFDDAGFVSQASYMAADAYLRVGPQLAMLGIAALLGAGFVLALRWQPDPGGGTSSSANPRDDNQVWQRGQK